MSRAAAGVRVNAVAATTSAIAALDTQSHPHTFAAGGDASDAHRRPDALEGAETLDNLRLPGFGLHPLKGKPVRYSIKINGPWRITFEWDETAGDAHQVDLEQYH